MHTTEKNEIIAMLGSYAALLVPESGKSLHFTLPGQLYPIDFKIPVNKKKMRKRRENLNLSLFFFC